MPNWTTNGLICHEDDLKSILDAEGNVDFNRVLPMPEELQITRGSITDLAEKYLAAFEAGDKTAMGDIEKHLPLSIGIKGEKRDISNARALLDVGRLYRSNRERFGAPTWYEWSCDKWGTKWNACNTEVADLGGGWRAVTFDTAWCPPDDNLLSKMFDGFGHIFHMEAYDEDYDGIYCTSAFYTGDTLHLLPSVFQEILDGEFLTAMYAPSITASALDELDAAPAYGREAQDTGLDLEAEGRDMREVSGVMEPADGPARENER